MNLRGNVILKLCDKCIGIPVVLTIGILLKIIPRPARVVPPQNILIVKLSALGDSILLIPSLRALREAYLHARIICVCTSINEVVFKAIPYIDEVITIQVKKLIINPLYLINTIWHIRRKKIDIAFDFDQWLRISPLIAALSGAPRRIGFKTEGQLRHFAFTTSIEHKKELHELESFLLIVEAVTGTKSSTHLEFPVSSNARADVLKMLRLKGYHDKMRVLVIHPGCGTHGWQREWPVERYVELIKKINNKNICYVLTGSTSETALTDFISKQLSGYTVVPLINLPFPLLAAVLSLSRYVISGNTGIMHLAAAVGAACVALHGPTNPKKWGPYGTQHKIIQADIDCAPCLYLGYEYGCTDNTCMRSINVETVYNQLSDL
ncbi:MAG: glycosyltransferase family 9 protein [bacterium]